MLFQTCIHCGFAYRSFLHSQRFLELFESVEVANFEIASDAFTTFKVGEQYLRDLKQACKREVSVTMHKEFMTPAFVLALPLEIQL